MKPEWRPYAPFGLYLAALALVASIGLYIWQRQVNLPVQIALGMIVIGLALFAILDPDRIRRSLTGRQARYGSNALVLTLAFVGILAVINFVVYNNTWRWDLTEDKQFTLAPETVDVLGKLPEPVIARAFFTTRTPRDTAEETLSQYKTNSDGKFDYQFIDPESDPLAAQAANVTQDGTVVLYMGERQQPVRFVTEQEITGAMVRLMNPEARVIYFLTGHGEYSPEDTGEQSYSTIKRTMEGKNYTVKMLNLLTSNSIPEDAKLIVIGGPREVLRSSEIDLLRQYQAAGGNLLVMVEPSPLTQYGDAPDLLSEYLLQDWGIEVGNDMVIDLTSQQPFAPLAGKYGAHPITEPMQRTTTAFLTARSVRAVGSGGAGVSLVELVLTAEQSWAETNLTGINDGQTQLAFDEGQDLIGPIGLAVAGENLESKARMVVFGDADFVIDVNFGALGNSDLLMNAVDWAIGQENLISLTPKSTTQRIIVPPQAAVLNLIFLASVIFLPAVALFSGIYVFVQRRRRG